MARQFINPIAVKHSIDNSINNERQRINRATISKQTIKSVFKYLHIDSSNIKEAPHQVFKNTIEEINYYFSSHNIRFRQVKLTSKWSHNAIGPLLVTLKKSNHIIALIPNANGRGYHYRNPKSNFIHFVRSFNERLFDQDAYSLYRPFENKKLTFKDFFKFILTGVSPLEIAEYIAVVIIASFLGIGLPYITKWIFNEIAIAPNVNALYSFIVFIGSFMLISLLFTCYKLFNSSRIRLKIRSSLQAAAIERLTSLPVNFFKKYSAGNLAVRLTYLSSTAEVLVDSLGTTVISLIFVLIYLVQIFAFSTILAIIGIVTTLITMIFDVVVIIYAERNISSRIKIDAKENGMSYAMIAGIEKIKAAGAERRMYNRWFDLFRESAELTYNPPFVIKIRGVINLLISLFGYLFLYIMAIETKIDAANYYAFSSIYTMAVASLVTFNNNTLTIAQIRPYYDMGRVILETLPESGSGQLYITKLNGEIRFDHVSFKYDKKSPNVIDDLSLNIKPGQQIAIVGETGSGKSTLIRLLLGFEKAQKGTIYYDKNDINDLELKPLRHLIGTVMQDTRIFAGDVYSNIVISSPWRSVQDAWDAAKIAAFDEVIKEMPMGMKTMLQEGEGGISGGQRQRLAIARAVVNHPKILIFDEATSALDNITQKKISDEIRKLECTRLIIAHRLSTVIDADQIYVLKNGKVTEHGTYKELCKRKGEFSKLMSRQKL